MGRSIHVDENVQKSIEQLINSNKWYTGVIIGQVTGQRDYVIHIAQTPEPVEDEALEEYADSDSDNKTSKSKKKSVIRPSSLEQLDDKWVSTHAKQVCRMLPGGLSVVGLFALAPTSMLQSSQIKLKQLMFTVHKSLTRNPLLVPPDEITDRIILQIDSKTRKITCTTLDVSDGKSTPRPADWRYQSMCSRWTQLDSQLSIDIPITVAKDSKSQTSLLKQLQGGLSAFCESVRQSTMSVDGSMREGSEPLVVQSEQRKTGKGAKDKGKGENTNNIVSNVRIFLPLTSVSSQEMPHVDETVATLRVCGKVAVRAFVPAKATIDDAVQAVKTDIVRSVHARCELLCEEVELTDDKDDGFVYNPPVRYFFPSPNGGVDFCDYAFEDEKEEEMQQRIEELLDIKVEGLEDAETHATEEDTWSYLSSSPDDYENTVPTSGDYESNSGVVKTYMMAAVGGLVAMLASGLSYMYLSE